MKTRQDPYSYPEKEQTLLDSKNDHRAEVVLPEDKLFKTHRSPINRKMLGMLGKC